MKRLYNAGKMHVPRVKSPEQGSRKHRPGRLKMPPASSGGTKTAPGFWPRLWRRWRRSFSVILALWRLKKKSGQQGFPNRRETIFAQLGAETGNGAYSCVHALLANHLPSALTFFCACVTHECTQRFLYNVCNSSRLSSCSLTLACSCAGEPLVYH